MSNGCDKLICSDCNLFVTEVWEHQEWKDLKQVETLPSKKGLNMERAILKMSLSGCVTVC